MKKIENLPVETWIILIGLGICLLMMLIGGLITGSLYFVIGVLVGGSFSVLNFKLLQYTLEKSVKMPPGKAQTYIQTRYMLRYLLTGVVIYIAIVIPYIDVIGLILGLIANKLSVLLCKALLKNTPFK
ncbi:ATP synthase subunit I [Eubacteriaceae bacterium ES3]|nr:ATP synthase subunit I [Eubacteriaceae bacterium ES3]